MVCFSGRQAIAQGQDITYVTERAVFRLAEDGLVLVEVAPGIDVEADVLAHAAFPIRVASDVATMDARLFREEPLGMALLPRKR
jgi:acyl CoA:acetate/3-ketoacid CoA transferase